VARGGGARTGLQVGGDIPDIIGRDAGADRVIPVCGSADEAAGRPKSPLAFTKNVEGTQDA
jgi:hypothetical protein